MTVMDAENARLHALVYLLTEELEERDRLAMGFPFVFRKIKNPYGAEFIAVYYAFHQTRHPVLNVWTGCRLVLTKGPIHPKYDHKGYISNFMRDVLGVTPEGGVSYEIGVKYSSGSILSFCHQRRLDDRTKYGCFIYGTGNGFPCTSRLTLHFIERVYTLGNLQLVIE